MAITRIGQGTGTNTATLPTLAVDDLIVVCAYRDGSATPPTVPAAFSSGVITTGGGSTNSMVVAALEVTTGSEVVGTWTGATSLIAVVYRGVDLTAPGGSTKFGSSNTTVNYSGLMVQDATGGNCLVAFGGHRSTNTAIETPPTGFSLVTSVLDASDELACFERFGSPVGYNSIGSVVVGGTSSGYRTSVFEMLPAATSGGSYSITVTPSAVTNTGASVSPKSSRSISVASASLAVTGAGITPKIARKVGITPAAVTVSGAGVSIKAARKLQMAPAQTSLSGSNITPTVTAAFLVEPGTITLNGADIDLAYAGGVEPQPEPEPAPAEVNWPGTTIPRSQFKAMQRAALARALAEARRERQETLKPQPAKKATRKAARRVLRVMAADGLLSPSALSGAERPLAQAIAGTISFQDLIQQFDAMLLEMEARLRSVDDQYEDEAVSLLLMAA